jgi:3-hydroxy-5-methyl-1-naphthoate 3-O-methyltransferase
MKSYLLRKTRERALSILKPHPRRRETADASGTPPEAKTERSPSPERIMQIAWGFAPPLILETALNFRVFDELDEKEQTLKQLADRCGASERGMRALLNALVGLEFLTRKGERYALTPESAAFLVSTRPSYRGSYFRHATRQLMPRWLNLAESVRTGRPARGTPENAGEFFAEFVESLFPFSYEAAKRLGEHLDIRKAAEPVNVLDIGAGSGVWGIALAQLSPYVKVLAVDWPVVLEVTRKVARRECIGERLRTVGGDLLEADFGSGHHVAIVGNVLHGEGAERSRLLLRKAFGALAPGGTVAISEFLPDETRTGPPKALLFAVNMLLNTEAGDTFTFAEISGWLREAGFADPRLLEAPAPSPLVLASKPL